MVRLWGVVFLAAWFGGGASEELSTRNSSSEIITDDDNRVMVCYYGSWAVYRPGAGKFDVEDINAEICTHLIYGFAGLKGDTHEIVSLDPYNDLDTDYGKGAYKRFTRLKKLNPELKTLLAIGGWNEGSSKYSEMASTASSRDKFITSCILFLQKFGFDGLDLDWEYPTLRGGQKDDKYNFAMLLEEMRARFDKHELLLTAAVSAGKVTIDAAYNVSALARNLDLVHLMAYDFHGSWEQYAHHHSPLYAYARDNGTNAELNVDFAVRYWLELGIPQNKLVIGIGLYGRCFTLARADQHDVYATSYQPGLPGPYTRSPGILGYNEICESEMHNSWAVVRDAHMVSPYAYKDRQWCGYDDMQSVEIKASYIVSLGLAGAMVWSIETDDFHGTCGGGTFPLITTIRTVLRDGEPIPTPTPPPTPTPTPEPETTTDTTTTTTPLPPPPPSDICHREGLNTDPEDCTAFYDCHQVGDEWQVYHFHCAAGTVFVEELQTCDFAEDHQDLCVNNTRPAVHLLPNSVDYEEHNNELSKAKKVDHLGRIHLFKNKQKEIDNSISVFRNSVSYSLENISPAQKATMKKIDRHAKKLRLKKKLARFMKSRANLKARLDTKEI